MFVNKKPDLYERKKNCKVQIYELACKLAGNTKFLQN